MIVLPLLLIAQQGGTEPPLQQDTKPAPWPDQMQFDQEGLPRDSSPNSRKAMQEFGACVADGSTEKAGRTLASDFRTKAYSRAFDQLVDANQNCTRWRGWRRMQASRLLLAGAMAERLILRDTAPVNVRLAKAALSPAPQSYSPSDAGAVCVVRSAPDEVGRLFATEIGSAQEDAAAKPLTQVLSLCMRGGPVDINVSGLRAILATAAYRSLQPQAGI